MDVMDVMDVRAGLSRRCGLCSPADQRRGGWQLQRRQARCTATKCIKTATAMRDAGVDPGACRCRGNHQCLREGLLKARQLRWRTTLRLTRAGVLLPPRLCSLIPEAAASSALVGFFRLRDLPGWRAAAWLAPALPGSFH